MITMGKVNTGSTNRSPLLLPRGPEEESWIVFEIVWIRDEDWCTTVGVVKILNLLIKFYTVRCNLYGELYYLIHMNYVFVAFNYVWYIIFLL